MSEHPFTVYFDGACPLCRREIGFYRKQRGAEAIDWVDVSADPEKTGADLSCAAALKRFHVRDETGALTSGAAAFSALWRRLPAFAWLGRLSSLPLISHVAEGAYRLFLRIRPAMQKIAA